VSWVEAAGRGQEFLELVQDFYAAIGVDPADVGGGASLDARASTSEETPVRISEGAPAPADRIGGAGGGDVLAGGRPDWHARAACRGVGADVFFPRRGGSAVGGRRLCEGCEVAYECLGYGLDNGCWGVWGGFALRDGGEDSRVR